jgi:hypothetical protein
VHCSKSENLVKLTQSDLRSTLLLFVSRPQQGECSWSRGTVTPAAAEESDAGANTFFSIGHRPGRRCPARLGRQAPEVRAYGSYGIRLIATVVIPGRRAALDPESSQGRGIFGWIPGSHLRCTPE